MRADFPGSKSPLFWQEHVKAAMEQAVEQPGVDYVALVDLQNRVILSAGDTSSLEMYGASTRTFLSSLKDRRRRTFVSRNVEMDGSGDRFFQMAAPFNPFNFRGQADGRGARAGMHGRMMNRFGHHPEDENFSKEIDRLVQMRPLLLVQLRSEQFSSPIRRQLQQMTILLLVFILVAIGAVLSVLTLRGLKVSRVRIGRIEKELQRSERMAALGKMAAGVAHELRNPLSSIKGLALLLKSKIKDETGGKETADILVGEVERLDRSIGELLDYAKPARLNRKSLKINTVVEKTVQLIAMDIKSQRISLKLDLADDLPGVSGDEDKLVQLFLNLLLNGLQAMESDGLLSVKSFLNDDYIAVVIADSGNGIAPENLPRIFDPYFTTRNDGTGLGLAMSAKIVDEHEGKIIVTSEQGKGSRVMVLLPAELKKV